MALAPLKVIRPAFGIDVERPGRDDAELIPLRVGHDEETPDVVPRDTVSTESFDATLVAVQVRGTQVEVEPFLAGGGYGHRRTASG